MKLGDEENYQNSSDCHICNKKIPYDKNKVRDHCHITGKYRGPAHRSCNSKFKISRKLTIFFHNLQGYDGHLIFKELHNYEQIEVIPKSIEKYMSIMVNKNISLSRLNAILKCFTRYFSNQSRRYTF